MSEKNRKWLEDGKELSRNFPQGQRVYSADGIASTIAGNAGGLGGKTGLYAIPVLTPDRINKRQHGRRFKENGDDAFTLTGQDIHGVMVSPMIRAEHHNTADVHFKPQRNRIRRLTPVECERLQGFPDNWTIGSDTQRYRQCGNAVTVPVIQAIGERILEEMSENNALRTRSKP